MRSLVVLEGACGLLESIPYLARTDWRWYRAGDYGCRWLRLASLSDRLDQRWGTGVWRAT